MSIRSNLGRQRNPSVLVAIAIAAFVIFGLLASIGVDTAMRESARRQTEAAAQADAKLNANALQSELDKFSLVPLVLAEDPQVVQLLDGSDRDTRQLNLRFETLARQTGAADIYLMDKTGTTLVASNWNKPTSFVSSNYGFRRYFRDAVSEGSGTEFALGTVSRRPGLYLAQRVDRNGKIIGVVAVKVEFDQMEAAWRAAAQNVFVTNREGIVIITSDPERRFAINRPIDLAKRDRASDLRRYGVDEFELLSFDAGKSHHAAIALDESLHVIRPEGWSLHLLAELTPATKAAIATGRLYLLTFLILLGLLAGIAGLLRRRRQLAAEKQVLVRTATLRDQLSQANRLATLGQVTAGVGHEIRQPLAAAKAFAENGVKLLEAGDQVEAANNFGRISAMVERIGQITDELLRFSRRTPHEPKRVRIGEVIDGALLLLRDRFERQAIKLIVPGESEKGIEVLGEHVRLEQVLVNLLQNAVDSTGDGGTVEVGIHESHERCLLSVTDDGPGLPPQLIERLFHPFATSKPEGLGLGLVISQDIMRSLGGELTVEPRDRGARFVMAVAKA